MALTPEQLEQSRIQAEAEANLGTVITPTTGLDLQDGQKLSITEFNDNE